MRPSSAGCPPAARLNSVDLPLPLGPITPTTSPGATTRLTPLTAVTPPKRLTTDSSTRGDLSVEDVLIAGDDIIPLLELAKNTRNQFTPSPTPNNETNQSIGQEEHHHRNDQTEDGKVHHSISERGPDITVGHPQHHRAQRRPPNGAQPTQQNHDHHLVRNVRPQH